MTSATAGLPEVHGHHAHVYYDVDTLPLAEKLRKTLAAGIPVELARFSA
jgi:aromatic ring-cleaving dioxygenase